MRTADSRRAGVAGRAGRQKRAWPAEEGRPREPGDGCGRLGGVDAQGPERPPGRGNVGHTPPSAAAADAADRPGAVAPKARSTAGLLARIQRAARAQRAGLAGGDERPYGQEPTHLPDGAATHRAGLYIAPSTIPGLRELGLFSATKVPPGDFIGMFSGDMIADEEIDGLTRARQDAVHEWAMDIGCGYSVCPH